MSRTKCTEYKRGSFKGTQCYTQGYVRGVRAEGYVRGLPANRRLRGSVRGAGQQVDDANVLRELVQGSELGYRDATLNLAYVLTSATEQSFYGYLIDAFADQETKKGLLGKKRQWKCCVPW